MENEHCLIKGKNLKIVCSHSRLSTNEISRKIKIPYYKLSKIQKSNEFNITLDELTRITKGLVVSKEHLTKDNLTVSDIEKYRAEIRNKVADLNISLK